MAGTGFHLAKISAASAMKPLPAVMLLPKPEPWAMEKNAPASPQSSPVISTAW